MFTLQHFIWLFISIALVVCGIVYLQKKKPPMKTVLSIACVICVLSELIKTFSSMQMIPSENGKEIFLYIEMQHLPLHLCSIQILFIFYTRFTTNQRNRTTILAFIYPTATLGAAFALFIPTIFSTSIDISQAFTHPLAYQYFLYHTMLIILGSYVALSGQVDIQPKHYFSTVGILAALAYVSIYLNSMFADVNYDNDKLISVDYSPNFFFTYRTPIGIELTEIWQWIIYLAIIIVLALSLIGLMFWIYFKAAKQRKVQ